MDAVMRLMTRLQDQSVLMRTNDRGDEKVSGVRLGAVEFRKEFAIDRLESPRRKAATRSIEVKRLLCHRRGDDKEASVEEDPVES